MIILQVSKIPDSAFTKCKVRLKNVFHVKKYLQVWILVYIFVLFKKRILIICFNCFLQTFCCMILGLIFETLPPCNLQRGAVFKASP